MINKTSLYVIKALTEMARLEEGEHIGAAELGKLIKVPQNYLGKSLQVLVRKGFLISRKGKGGGFALKKKTLSTPLLTVVEGIDDMDRWSNCFLNLRKCRETKHCALHDKWKAVRENYLNFLKTNTIKDCL